MKIRNGFVSNSSSTSYTICLPDDFDVNCLTEETVDIQCHYHYDEEKDDEVQYTLEELRQFVKLLISSGSLTEWEGHPYDMVAGALHQFVVSSEDGSSEDGSISLLHNKMIRSILNGEIKIEKKERRKY